MQRSNVSPSPGSGTQAPASGAAMLATRTAGAYATVRKQFNLSIAKFEGIEEPLARIGGMTYAMDAARVLAAGAVDAGERPSVASAIVKCYLTEGMRRTINDAMDIAGGTPRRITSGSRGRAQRSSPDGPRRAASSAASAEPLDRSRRRSA